MRSKPPTGFAPEAKAKSPLPTNCTICRRSTVSGSLSRVREPSRKLWRRLVSGQAPLSLNAGGQRRSMYPAPTLSFSNASDFNAWMTRPASVALPLEWPAPKSMSLRPSASSLSRSTTKR